jgi:pimeloyl-ACP methyl ester carboxylesterase
MLETLQGQLIFGRTRVIRPLQLGPHAGAYRIDAHRLERPDGAVLEGWSSTPLDGPARGALLYFGGRNENVVWAPDMASFNPGWAIHAFNYRGFGGSTGRASERRAKADARALLDVVAASAPAAELAIVGRSLGTAVALAAAAQARPRRLVLLSPFESVPAVLRTRPFGGVSARLVTQRFDCGALAAAHGGATLVLLAEADDTIPHAQSRRLCALLPGPSTVQTIAGTTHRTLPRSGGAQRAIAAFLAGQHAEADARPAAPPRLGSAP